MTDPREIAAKLTKAQREVRVLERYRGVVIPVVRLGIVGNWSMVRNPDFPGAMPFVISNKDWERAEVRNA